MKQGKRLTREQKEKLNKQGYDWKDWLYQSEDETAILFVHKATKEICWIEKG